MTVTKDRVKDVQKAIRDLTNKRVLIGIPEEKAERIEADSDGKPSPASNAVIGYVQEFGEPSLNIPPRAFLVPGVQNIEEAATRRLLSAGKKALDGDVDEVTRQLNAIGLTGAASVRDKMDAGPFTPLADSTIKARISRGKGKQVGAIEEMERRKAGEAPGTDLVQPLIDTGNLQNSITYVIRDSRNRH